MSAKRTAFGLALAIGVLAFPARAERPKDCQGIVNQEGYKVVLDQVLDSDAVAGSAAAKVSRERVRAAMVGALQRLALDGDSVLALVTCDDRLPSDASVFTASDLAGLDKRSVILEIWGLTENTPATGREALLNYLMVPLTKPPGVTGLPRAIPRSYHNEHSEDVLAIFGSAKEIAAFSLIGLGAKSAALEEYDHALEYLCKGEEQLVQGQAAGAHPEDARLLEYVRTRVGDVAEKLGLHDAGPGGSVCRVRNP